MTKRKPPYYRYLFWSYSEIYVISFLCLLVIAGLSLIAYIAFKTLPLSAFIVAIIFLALPAIFTFFIKPIINNKKSKVNKQHRKAKGISSDGSAKINKKTEQVLKDIKKGKNIKKFTNSKDLFRDLDME